MSDNHIDNKRPSTPFDLFKLAAIDPIIKANLNAWQAGHCTWETTLINIICTQHNKLQQLLTDTIKLRQLFNPESHRSDGTASISTSNSTDH